MNKLNQQCKILASQPNYEDVINLLRCMADDVSDVRSGEYNNDSLDLRQSMAKYLKEVIDNMQRTRKNMLARPEQADDDV